MLNTLKNFFFEVLAIQLKQYKVKNRQAVVTYFNSKKVCEELLAIGIPVSPKKNLIVPEWIMNKSSFTASFLKGLFDTDGCITRQKQGKYSYTLYKFTMKEKGFAKQVHTCLNKLRIDSFVCFKGANNPAFEVVVRKKKSIEEFDKLIQSEKGKIKTGA